MENAKWSLYCATMRAVATQVPLLVVWQLHPTKFFHYRPKYPPTALEFTNFQARKRSKIFRKRFAYQPSWWQGFLFPSIGFLLFCHLRSKKVTFLMPNQDRRLQTQPRTARKMQVRKKKKKKKTAGKSQSCKSSSFIEHEKTILIFFLAFPHKKDFPAISLLCGQKTGRHFRIARTTNDEFVYFIFKQIIK